MSLQKESQGLSEKWQREDNVDERILNTIISYC